MNLQQYQLETKRTCPNLGSEATDLSHMVLGIFTEYSEYLTATIAEDIVNIGEEIADKFWYISNYCTFRGYDLLTLWENRESTEIISESPELDYLYYLAELSDLVKKFLAYNKTIDRNKEEIILKSILYNLEFLYVNYNIDLNSILQNNIDKLYVRFPAQEGFSQQRATTRDLESERRELEK